MPLRLSYLSGMEHRVWRFGGLHRVDSEMVDWGPFQDPHIWGAEAVRWGRGGLGL